MVYYLLNRIFQGGNQEGLELFRDYALALRGSMCTLGEPVINLYSTVYRGINLSKDNFEEWKRNKGSIILLNGYTSTTLDRNKAMTFTDQYIIEF